MTIDIERLRKLLTDAPAFPSQPHEVSNGQGFYHCPVCDGDGSLDAELVSELRWGPGDAAIGGVQVYGIGDPHAALDSLIPQAIKAIPGLLDEIEALRKQRNELASDLWHAEDQWGDDYLWKKWNLSEHLTEELKKALS
jgi:hypothetical protein